MGQVQDSIPYTAIRLSPLRVHGAVKAWARFKAGDHAALNSPGLGVVFSVLGFVAGQRLRLRWPQAFLFGHSVSALITDYTMGHGNDAEVLRVEEIASYVVYGTTQRVGRACGSPEVCERYRRGMAVVVRALREGYSPISYMCLCP